MTRESAAHHLTRKQVLVGGLAGVAGLAAVGAGAAAGRYIVVASPGADPAGLAAAHGASPDLTFSAALNGFAGPLSAAQVAALRADARVLYVEPDRVVSLVRPVAPPRVRAQLHENNFETLTTGINRIDADLNPRTDVSAMGIAIIDTGIWLTHVDLNVAGNVTFVTGTKSGNDDNGHGTHVAGIAAAKTNDSKGVRGVAPNARLYAVKVLDRNGSGFLSWVIKGVDWVTTNAAGKGIRVANMSLGFEGTSSALNTAIANSVSAGVSYVVAAGNSGKDAATFSPANHPGVITISAIADSDGKCGGAGAATAYGADDTFATFSNFGSVVELAAPGVDITSAYKGDKQNPGGLYATMSGTSMAAPHAAGAAAQYIASNPGSTPAAVRDALISGATPQSPVACTPDATGRLRGGFVGDADGFLEPLVDAATL